MENASNVATIELPEHESFNEAETEQIKSFFDAQKNKNTLSKGILEQALEIPCPFCGATDLSSNFWSLNGGEVDAVECNRCHAGAPAESWVKRACQD